MPQLFFQSFNCNDWHISQKLRHTRKQANISCNQQKQQSVDTRSDFRHQLYQMLTLANTFVFKEIFKNLANRKIYQKNNFKWPCKFAKINRICKNEK